jgi:hypothetical protein
VGGRITKRMKAAIIPDIFTLNSVIILIYYISSFSAEKAGWFDGEHDRHRKKEGKV